MDRFEDLVIWRRAHSLARALCGQRGYSALNDQMRRSAISVVSNIAEGCGRGNYREFRRYLVIALGSCEELRAQLRLASDCGALIRAQEMHEEARQISCMIRAFISNLERRL
jgi:four helix bundle protein